jgi:Lon protease-like protein
MVLPLHIFEERYKLMIHRCLEEQCSFGVVLLREGQEVGGGAVPHAVGTTAVIAGVSRLGDGRMNIATVGSERFRLLGVRREQPYLVGSAVPWPFEDEDAKPAREQVEPVQMIFRQYQDLLVQAMGEQIEVEEIPSEPRALALLVAAAVQVSMVQKQSLLNQPTIGELLRAERHIMRRECSLLQHILRTQSDQWEGGYSGYLARN